MPNYVIYDTATNDVKRYLISDPNDPTYPVGAGEGFLKDPNVSSLVAFPIKYWKQSSGAVALKSAAEQTATDAAINTALTLAQRTSAKSTYDNTNSEGKILRALVLTLLDEINILRGRDRDRATDMAASGSLAALKTAWAARSSLTDRTAAQAKTAIQSRIDSGAVDS